jgi:hypothetical protein
VRPAQPLAHSSCSRVTMTFLLFRPVST